MKTLTFFLTIFYSLHGHSQSIRGEVYDLETKKALLNSKTYLLKTANENDSVDIYYSNSAEGKFKIIDSTITDSLGTFAFNNIKSGKYTVAAQYLIPYKDHIPIDGYGIVDNTANDITIKSKTNYQTKIYIRVTCKYDKTKDLEFCPKCKKKDKVLKILYGLPNYDENGEVPGYYLAGCVGGDLFCEPTKHCSRCKLEF